MFLFQIFICDLKMCAKLLHDLIIFARVYIFFKISQPSDVASTSSANDNHVSGISLSLEHAIALFSLQWSVSVALEQLSTVGV